jgi:hypothetical protein
MYLLLYIYNIFNFKFYYILLCMLLFFIYDYIPMYHIVCVSCASVLGETME